MQHFCFVCAFIVVYALSLGATIVEHTIMNSIIANNIWFAAELSGIHPGKQKQELDVVKNCTSRPSNMHQHEFDLRVFVQR